MKKKLILSLILMIIVLFFVGCGKQEGSYEYNKAQKAYKKGNLIQARSLFEKVLLKTTSNNEKAKISNQLGLILWDLNEFQEAKESFRTAVNLSSTYNESAINYGILLFHEKKLSQSKNLFNNVLLEDPENINANIMMGCVLMAESQFEEAIKKIEIALSVYPNNPKIKNLYLIANLYLKNTNAAATIELLNEIILSDPNYLPAHYNSGIINDKWLNNNKSAHSNYSFFVTNNKTDINQSKKANEALNRINSLNQTTEEDPALVNRIIDHFRLSIESKAERAYKEKDYTEAIKYYIQITERDPTLKAAYYNLGLCYLQKKNYENAENIFKKALELDEEYSDARYMLSLTYWYLKDYDKSEEEANELMLIDTDRAKVMLNHINTARMR